MRSLEELEKMKVKTEKELALREKKGNSVITVHMGTCGIANGAETVLDTVLSELKARKLTNIHVTQTGCPGLCYLEPLVTVTEPGKNPFIYEKVSPENVKKIIVQHLINGQPIREWLINLEK